MAREHIATLLEDALLSLDELTTSCSVSREWVLTHVKAGVLMVRGGPQPESWQFGGHELRRARRLLAMERDFEANPELAGLVADLFEEIERLRTRLRRASLPID